MLTPQLIRPVAALFVRRDSCYKTLPGVDAWDEDRDARRWPGGCPVVAHPPCRAWGGVLEHPASSMLWPYCGLPRPGNPPDRFGGWTLPIDQHWWGHRAQKRTLLYIVGVAARDLPALPIDIGEPTHVVQSRKRVGSRPHITKAEREHTPPELARWLVELARSTSVDAGRDAA